MGYRSEVGIAYAGSKEAIGRLKAALDSGSFFEREYGEHFEELLTADDREWLEILRNAARVKENGDKAVLTIYLDHTKWYEEADSVRITLDEEAESLGCSGRFVRLGEDDQDVEDSSFGDYPPYDAIRHINCLIPAEDGSRMMLDHFATWDFPGGDNLTPEQRVEVATKAVEAARKVMAEEIERLTAKDAA